MNQTRVFLIFAWLMVAVLLWMEWSRERLLRPRHQPPRRPRPPHRVFQARTPAPSPAPRCRAPGQAAQAQASATPASQRVTVTTDVLRLVLDGGRVLDAELLQFRRPRTKAVRRSAC